MMVPAGSRTQLACAPWKSVWGRGGYGGEGGRPEGPEGGARARWLGGGGNALTGLRPICWQGVRTGRLAAPN